MNGERGGEERGSSMGGGRMLDPCLGLRHSLRALGEVKRSIRRGERGRRCYPVSVSAVLHTYLCILVFGIVGMAV